MVMIGILPTIDGAHLNADAFSANPRYTLLNEQIFAARGEDLEIDIGGVERLSTYADTIAPEAACTSVQLHLQVEPEAFAAYWNAAQAIAGVQVAVGANSPFFFGKELWRETRIALFEQATDTRPDELKAQGVRPRVWFGERWITSIFDLFEENVRYFPALLPVCEDEDPVEVLDARRHPRARRAAPAQRHDLPLEPADLRRRPRPPAPARREPRPARRARPWSTSSPTPPSTTGWCASSPRTTGRCGRRCRSRPPRRTSTRRPRRHRRAGLLAGRGGGAGRRARTAPAAAAGPRGARPPGASTPPTATACSGSSSAAASPCATAPRGRAPSSTASTTSAGCDRDEALRRMTVRYLELMHANEPVHDWPLD